MFGPDDAFPKRSLFLFFLSLDDNATYAQLPVFGGRSCAGARGREGREGPGREGPSSGPFNFLFHIPPCLHLQLELEDQDQIDCFLEQTGGR